MSKPFSDYKSRNSDAFQKPKTSISLYVIIFLLAAGFLILIALVFALSSSGWSPLFFGNGKCIAVITIDQEISIEGASPSIFSEGNAGSEEIANLIYDINKREDIAGVLFVINSPGGGVVATREIYSAVKELKKPKVAYFREVAASGGYYISSGMDYIISDPNAITGSIGVIATFTDMSGLFDKVGLNTTAIKSGLHKDIGSPARPMTPEERDILNSIINETFGEFKSIVMENRKNKLNMEKFEQVLDGRILSGRQAKEVGLVDELGSKRDAIKKVAELSGLPKDDPRTCQIKLHEEQKGLFGLESALQGIFAHQPNKVSLKLE